MRQRLEHDGSQNRKHNSENNKYFILNRLAQAQSPGGWGGYLTKFYTGRLRPEVQPFTLSYTILAEKAPLLYIFYWKKVLYQVY